LDTPSLSTRFAQTLLVTNISSFNTVKVTFQAATYIASESQSRDSSVGIALGYGLDDLGYRVPFLAGAGDFSLHYRVQNGSRTHLASYQWAPGALSLGVKRPGREADHSPPSSADVK
jgi:hypothetical protein